MGDGLREIGVDPVVEDDLEVLHVGHVVVDVGDLDQDHHIRPQGFGLGPEQKLILSAVDLVIEL